MTNPPHGDAEPERLPGPEAGGRSPQAGPPSQAPAAYGRPAQPAWGQQPWPQEYGGPQPYGQPPAGSGPLAPPGAAPYGAPGHGAPGHGSPRQLPARRRSRAGLLAALAVVGVAVLVGIAVLALSTGPTVLSRTAVERDVAAQFEQREGVAVDLRCAL